MQIKLMVLSILFIFILAYIIYKILDETRYIKREKITENMRYLERQIETAVQIEKRKSLLKYKNYLDESILSELHITIYIFVIIALGISLITFREIKEFLNNPIAGLLIAFFIFFVPFMLLEFEVTFRRRKIRKHLPHFLLMFQQTYEATGDTLETLKTIKNEIKDPLKTYIKSFLNNMTKEMGVKGAAEILKSKTDNRVFRDFVDNLYLSIENGKNFKYELENSIKIAYANEEQYTQRIAENSGNIMSIVMILIIFIIGCTRIGNVDGDIMNVIRNSPTGKLMVNAVIVLFGISGYLVKSSITFND